ncbi:MAG: hypothetical protein RIT45_13 [Pseudomonadota bacterium]|jgi:hypothetical protein
MGTTDAADGTGTGPHAWWNEDGAFLGSTVFAAGNGTVELHHPGGAVYAEGTIKNGLRDGVWQSFVAKGQLLFDGDDGPTGASISTRTANSTGPTSATTPPATPSARAATARACWRGIGSSTKTAPVRCSASVVTR